MLFPLLLSICSGGFAQDIYSVSRVNFLPPVYYVGDGVEARIRLSVEDGYTIVEPSELPPPGIIHVRDVRIIPISGEYDIRIFFSSFETGITELPAIELGDVTLTGVEIEVDSILEEGDTSIVGTFGPVLLPGTKVLLALFIGALLIVPPLMVLLGIWLKRLVLHLRDRWHERIPIRDLNEEIDTLVAKAPNSRDFYIGLTEIFRRYLARKLEVDIRSYTSSELSNELGKLLPEVPAVEKISADWSRFDEIKFGKRRIKGRQRSRDVKKIRDTALAIEDWIQGERSHVDA
jgi:hypothetical protein